ncbi:Isoamylase 1, chloroplastic [Zea mays]|uniref:Isoamylase 1, chloroplastic n=1 Tax=Zea mays TaxID=4577 RepID=A0A3L6F6R7_MAIZE|nr:Isoamylase 1, chloroplastic [Zea mays]
MAATEQLKELGEKLQAVAPAPADELAKLLELIAEAWDAGGLYQVGQFPHWNVWSEWNGKCTIGKTSHKNRAPRYFWEKRWKRKKEGKQAPGHGYLHLQELHTGKC